MTWPAANVWWIPLFPLAAAGMISLMPRRAKAPAIRLALGGMTGALILSTLAFVSTLGAHEGGVAASRHIVNFDWFQLGTDTVRLGFMLDPLAAVMLVMVSFVGLSIFVYSTGYMAHDDNCARFFGFLSLFAAAMLGLVIANSLLLFFACWELVGLASYLLIGFWFQKPAAAAAATKAFLVTRIGDLGLFLGMLWLYNETGSLLFFDGGKGCLEGPALAGLASTRVTGTLSAAAAISLLLFVGAVGKSGQVPLHVWLPDAMEGPTPVSALIHAATMVAAGVFLVARVFPLMTGGGELPVAAGASPALQVVAGIGAITSVFAALLAVAQSDIKRVLAYSTVSQLGYMFLGLATGGVAVGMFHLITHACFKALLFLGAGSVIHGCHEEQDIRRMGALRRWMPVTFATYAVGMMALSGVPVIFSGFWSKDEILHAAWLWEPGKWPFALALFGAFLTAFYMTRQTCEVFLGIYRGTDSPISPDHGHPTLETARPAHATQNEADPESVKVRESPGVMTGPLVVLAVFTVLLSLVGTPAWPWFEAYLSGHTPEFVPARLLAALPMMLASTGVISIGIGSGWLLYGRRTRISAEAPDVLETVAPRMFASLRARLWVDEFYSATVVSLHRVGAELSALVDKLVIGGLVWATGTAFRLLAFVAKWTDELLVNGGFDAGCGGVGFGGLSLSRLQGGRAQRYLGGLALGMVVLTLVVVWGLRPG